MQKKQETAIVAASHELYGAGLCGMLQTEFGFRCKAVNSLEQTIDAVTRTKNVILLAVDSSLPGMRGPESIRLLRHRFPSLKILVLSESAPAEDVFQSVSAGAYGFVERSSPSTSILLAFKTVLAGNVYVPSSIAAPAPDNGEAPISVPKHSCLTARQKEIVRLMSQGNSNKVIARRLGISPSTVKVHLHAAFRALGVHSRIAAMSASSRLFYAHHASGRD